MERISAKRRFLGAAFAFAFLTGALPAGAQEINLQAPKEDQSLPREALTELQEKIDTTEALIESTREKERAVLQELEASDRRLEALRKKSDQATREAVKRGGRAKALEAEASAIRKSLALQQAALSNTLRRLYRQGSPSTAEVLLSSSTLTEAAERATYARRLARMDQQRIARYRETLEELAESRRRIKETSIRLTEDRAEADLKAKELLKQAEAKRALLASIQRERLRHEQTQAEMEEAARDLTALIARLDDKHKPEATYTVEPKRESRARDLPFAVLKGHLPWPIQGRLVKVSKRDAFLHKGLYIEALSGDPIEAVAGGTVVFSDYFRGYGNLIIIDHGTSYHTLYAHAQELDVHVGERVEEGQTIGRAGSSGAASAPTLYFELRHRGRPVDPLPWLSAHSQ